MEDQKLLNDNSLGNVVKSIFISFGAALVLMLSSCSSQKKGFYYYLENVNDTTDKGAVKVFEPVIQKNDQLSIQVYSAAIDPKVDALYNLTNTNTSATNNPALMGYLVDQNGNIEYPRVGLVHAEGLTKQQLADTLQFKLSNELMNPSVIIRYLNFRVTILGEVGHAGTISIPYERVNIFEAIGLAGDIPFSGKKNSVRVIREVNGDRHVGTIDLTAKNVFESPYFYLQQNDIVMVDPTKARVRTNEETIITQRITFALTFITTAALLYSLFK
jgi:polysaccharide export outer membrane protein